MAVPWTRLLALEASGASDAEQFEALVAVHTGILQTIGLLSLSCYVERGPASTNVDHVLRDRVLGKAVAAGDWADLVDRVLEQYSRAPKDCVLPPLISFWLQKSGKRTKESETLLDFVHHRNAWAHQKLPAESRPGLIAKFRGAFEKAIGALDFLGDAPIYIPLRAEKDGGGRLFIPEAVACHGTTLETQPTELWAEEPLRVGEDLILVEPRSSSGTIRLFPLVLPELGASESEDDLLVYERNRRAHGQPGTVVRVDYVGVRTRTQVTVDRRSSAAFVLPHFAKRFSQWLSEAEEITEPIPDPDAAFRSMPGLIASSIESFVGRDDFIRGIAASAARGSGQLITVVAPPGAGKTSALAALTRELPMSVAAHLVGPDGGRDDPRLIARALFAQVLARFRMRRSIPEGYGEALKAFHDLLRQLADGGEKIAIVVDALDELRRAPDGSPDLGLIPRPIPDGVFIVASTRPGDVEEALASIPGAEKRALPPMAADELATLARRYAPERTEVEVRAACTSSGGNPLFLRAILLTRDGALPSRVEEAFERAVKRVPQELDVARALTLFAATKSGLARRDLARLMGIAPFRAGQVIAALRPLLELREDRYSLFHPRLREWVAAELGDARSMIAAHSAIADLLAADLESGREESLRELPAHLEAANRGSELVARADAGFAVRAAIGTGSVEAARDALLAASRAAGGDLVRAARYGLISALLVRGSSLLARSGVLAAIARRGDARMAVAMARSVPDPEQRDAALIAVAEQLENRDAELAVRLREEAEAPTEPSERASDAPLLRAGELARLALDASAEDAPALVAEAIEAALVDRSLLVRTLLAAARALPSGLVLAMQALEEAEGEESAEAREPLIIETARVLARFDPSAAQEAAEKLPAGAARIRGFAAAGAYPEAIAEAEALESEEDRDRAYADLVESLADVDGERALELVQRIQNATHKDRALLALIETVKTHEVADAIADPGLRAGALARIGAWVGAEECLLAIEDPAARAAALERLAAAAAPADRERAKRYREKAKKLRAGLAGDEARAFALRETAALAAGDAKHALAMLDDAMKIDRSYAGQSDAMLRRAKILFAQPSGKNLREAIALTSSFADAFAGTYPDFVGALGEAFGAKLPDVVMLAVDAFESACAEAAGILAAGAGPDVDPRELARPRALTAGEIQKIASAEWAKPIVAELAPKPELDRLERALEDRSIDRAGMDRIVELYLAQGDRDAASRVLWSWAETCTTMDQAEHAAARAVEIQPVPGDARLRALAGEWRKSGGGQRRALLKRLRLEGAAPEPEAKPEPPPDIDLFGGDAVDAEGDQTIMGGLPAMPAPGLIDDNFDPSFEDQTGDLVAGDRTQLRQEDDDPFGRATDSFAALPDPAEVKAKKVAEDPFEETTGDYGSVEPKGGAPASRPPAYASKRAPAPAARGRRRIVPKSIEAPPPEEPSPWDERTGGSLDSADLEEEPLSSDFGADATIAVPAQVQVPVSETEFDAGDATIAGHVLPPDFARAHAGVELDADATGDVEQSGDIGFEPNAEQTFAEPPEVDLDASFDQEIEATMTGDEKDARFDANAEATITGDEDEANEPFATREMPIAASSLLHDEYQGAGLDEATYNDEDTSNDVDAIVSPAKARRELELDLDAASRVPDDLLEDGLEESTRDDDGIANIISKSAAAGPAARKVSKGAADITREEGVVRARAKSGGGSPRAHGGPRGSSATGGAPPAKAPRSSSGARSAVPPLPPRAPSLSYRDEATGDELDREDEMPDRDELPRAARLSFDEASDGDSDPDRAELPFAASPAPRGASAPRAASGGGAPARPAAARSISIPPAQRPANPPQSAGSFSGIDDAPLVGSVAPPPPSASGSMPALESPQAIDRPGKRGTTPLVIGLLGICVLLGFVLAYVLSHC